MVSFKKFLKKRSLFNNRGFSLISTLVASVIGLIVIFGLGRSLDNINTRSNQLKSQMQLLNLNSGVNSLLQSQCCYEVLEAAVDLSDSNVQKSYSLKKNGLNYFDGRGCNVTCGNCKIKMYYQLANDNQIHFTHFSCLKKDCYKDGAGVIQTLTCPSVSHEFKGGFLSQIAHQLNESGFWQKVIEAKQNENKNVK